MNDTIYRSDAIEAVRKIVSVETEIDATLLDKMDVIVELSELPSAENSNAKTQNSNQETQNSNGDLIYRADAIEALEDNKSDWDNDYNRPIEKDIQSLKALPSAETVQGEWEEKIIEGDSVWTRHRYYCSVCGGWNTYGKSDYCPDCGARMKGGDTE